MDRFIRAIVGVASLAMFLTVGATAQTQINICESKSGMIEFNGEASTSRVFIGSCGERNCILGDAYRGADSGNNQMWITGTKPLILATPDPNIFAVNMKGGTLNFSFSMAPGTIQGMNQLTVLRDGTSAPQFPRTMQLSGASGVFASLWQAANVTPLNSKATSSQGNALVAQVVNGLAGSTSVAIAGGVFPSAPEPASIALIGSGLLALGGVLKRRLRR